jgi:hypothetical protein
MPGGIWVIGVDAPEGTSRPWSVCPSDSMLGASNNDPLPSVVSRDSASSSGSRTRSLGALLLLAAYIRGAPMGQYMAVRYHRVVHSYRRMPAKWQNNNAYSN